jgi:hypothetical protein
MLLCLQGNGNNNDNVSFDNVAKGEHEVNLHDFGIPPKDIEAMRRIEACLMEVQKSWQAALAVGPSAPQMTTRAKGKETALTEAERQEQYKKLKEEEL